MGGMEPVLIFNKIDLAKNLNEIEIPVYKYKEIGYCVFEISTKKLSGLESLRKKLKGKKTVLCGHSGVGKSSIIKALYPLWPIKIGKVRAKTGTGKHTTIISNMYPLPDGGYLADTPGIGDLIPFNLNKRELSKYYEEFKPFINNCQYRGCLHKKEPDCGVKAALNDKLISLERYKSYCSLLNTLT